MNDIKLLELQLGCLLNHCTILTDGTILEERRLVERFGRIKIEIYPNEHPPAHFHVKGNDLNVSVAICDFQILEGELDSKTEKKIKKFYIDNRNRLINVWNELRPNNCQIGKLNC